MKKKINTSLTGIKKTIIPILKASGARRASIFGSAARGEMRGDSDVDILVDLPKEIGLFEFVAIKLRLEDALRRKVDLVEYGAIKPTLKESILRDQVSVI